MSQDSNIVANYMIRFLFAPKQNQTSQKKVLVHDIFNKLTEWQMIMKNKKEIESHSITDFFPRQQIPSNVSLFIWRSLNHVSIHFPQIYTCGVSKSDLHHFIVSLSFQQQQIKSNLILIMQVKVIWNSVNHNLESKSRFQY